MNGFERERFSHHLDSCNNAQYRDAVGNEHISTLTIRALHTRFVGNEATDERIAEILNQLAFADDTLGPTSLVSTDTLVALVRVLLAVGDEAALGYAERLVGGTNPASPEYDGFVAPLERARSVSP